ncbi:hypothetical protein CERSUDRAFT_76652 [Gelatoporia subvermispora B]|uniref:Uncharacterized protein n=1 Tax=Ceriporiopsis subvermispora (strain B) TaxID=914234 RepID=M2R5K4_CERS8|nr:hypothetical protein CERSUDRAFT_76652 [Gelatoporia subvermispora B]
MRLQSRQRGPPGNLETVEEGRRGNKPVAEQSSKYGRYDPVDALITNVRGALNVTISCTSNVSIVVQNAHLRFRTYTPYTQLRQRVDEWRDILTRLQEERHSLQLSTGSPNRRAKTHAIAFLEEPRILYEQFLELLEAFIDIPDGLSVERSERDDHSPGDVEARSPQTSPEAQNYVEVDFPRILAAAAQPIPPIPAHSWRLPNRVERIAAESVLDHIELLALQDLDLSMQPVQNSLLEDTSRLSSILHDNLQQVEPKLPLLVAFCDPCHVQFIILLLPAKDNNGSWGLTSLRLQISRICDLLERDHTPDVPRRCGLSLGYVWSTCSYQMLVMVSLALQRTAESTTVDYPRYHVI